LAIGIFVTFSDPPDIVFWPGAVEKLDRFTESPCFGRPNFISWFAFCRGDSIYPVPGYNAIGHLVKAKRVGPKILAVIPTGISPLCLSDLRKIARGLIIQLKMVISQFGHEQDKSGKSLWLQNGNRII